MAPEWPAPQFTHGAVVPEGSAVLDSSRIGVEGQLGRPTGRRLWTARRGAWTCPGAPHCTWSSLARSVFGDAEGDAHLSCLLLELLLGP